MPKLPDQCEACYAADNALARRAERHAPGGGEGSGSKRNYQHMTDCEREDYAGRAKLALLASRRGGERARKSVLSHASAARDVTACNAAWEKKLADDLRARNEKEGVAAEALAESTPSIVKKLVAALESGALPHDCIARKLLESQLDVALCENAKAIRWDPDIVELAQTLSYYGGGVVLHLLNGNMLKHSVSPDGKIDMQRTNLRLPGNSTIKRSAPKWSTAPGIHPICVYTLLLQLEAKGLPRVIRMGIDETCVMPSLQVDEQTSQVVGAVDRALSYEKITSGSVDVSKLTLANAVMAIHGENMLTPQLGGEDARIEATLGYVPMAAASMFDEETGAIVGGAEYLTRLCLETVHAAQTCKRCLELDLVCENWVDDASSTCGECALAECECVRMRVILLAGDSCSTNKRAMANMEAMREDGFPNLPLFCGDPIHVLKNSFHAAINYFMNINGERFGIICFRELIFGKDKELKRRAQSIGITLGNTKPVDKVCESSRPRLQL